ncbi:hypothetical protein QQS21_010297 [Conoideocrella luteorostrata]|uniref:Uncharacterized protein n=1 Tax=Conoideocrella luteorostrata TaxID=1105319 RepID=A0AAJ0CI05_9HYPO|nr:hypothetical protein QQS21_010297 [Conoideocrella luteorostrata]
MGGGYDYNVFTVFTACGDRASGAFKLKHNWAWLHRKPTGITEKPTIDSWEPTPDLPARDDRDADIAATTGRIILTLDMMLKSPLDGIQLGINPRLCKIFLGSRGIREISACECNLVVDESLRVWLRHYRSKFGTAVGYSHQTDN